MAGISCSHDVSDGAVKSSYLTANKLVQISNPVLFGELVKKCMLKAADVACPEKQSTLVNISLSRIRIADTRTLRRPGKPNEGENPVI